MVGNPALQAKKPDTQAAIPGSSGRISSGKGPPSKAKLGSQKPVSNFGFDRHAPPQSINFTAPFVMQMLSLRISQCVSEAPEVSHAISASSSAGSARSSQSFPASSSDRNGAGFLSTSLHPKSLFA